MDIQLLQQLVDSPSLVTIKYHGIPVYIDSIDEEKGTAQVFPLDDMDHVQEVDIDGLYEDDPVHLFF
ncbi:H-type small acid-soluble spore protein [Piscibacillus salipiscarius]|uniref:Small, acid-soluble spore protein H n=1 Tax=Piscibacillus salipiscarius TaxID=299480 RepID=A0ABW5QA67_9BACI|nr:H-type small acid-soluble spore protein [Piscibacillus salipiscarius]